MHENTAFLRKMKFFRYLLWRRDFSCLKVLYLFDNAKNNTMSTAELKLDIISRIANTNEIGVIEELKKLLDFELDKEIYQMTSEQERRVCEAKAEYLANNVLSEKDADDEIEQWLKEK